MREQSRLAEIPIYEDRGGNSRRFVPGDYALTRPPERIHASTCTYTLCCSRSRELALARSFARVHVSARSCITRGLCLGLLHSIRDIPHSSHTRKNTLVGTRCPRCLTLIRTAGSPPLPRRAIYGGPREHRNRLRGTPGTSHLENPRRFFSPGKQVLDSAPVATFGIAMPRARSSRSTSRQ